MNKFLGIFALVGLFILFSGSANAENHTVIVTQADDFSSYYFEPNVLEIEVGDNVENFKVNDKV